MAVNLVAFARFRGNLQGQAFVLFMLTVAACEAGLALALILILYRSRHSLDVSLWQELREPGQEPTVEEEAAAAAPAGDAAAQADARRRGTETPSRDQPCLTTWLPISG